MSEEYGGPSAEPLLQAAYRVVHRYPGGIEAVAKAIGRTPKYLLKAVSGLPGAKLNVEDSIAITQFTKDYEIVELMTARAGGKLVKLPPPTHETEDMDVLFRDVVRGAGMVIFTATLSLRPEGTHAAAAFAKWIGGYAETALPLLQQATISTNAMRRLSEAYFELPMMSAIGEEKTYVQFMSDLNALHFGLEARVRPLNT